MALAVVAVTKYGIPASQATGTYGLPVTVSISGYGLAVIPVAAGGMSVFDTTGTLFGPAVIPANTGLPVISGTPVAGNTLVTTSGTWSGSLATFTYQWKRGGVNISGATSNVYLLVAADIGSTITATVTATNTAGSASATSAATAVVTGLIPANTVAPVISGTAQDTQVLTVSSTGTWTGIPAPTFSYQWKRGATNVGTNSINYTLVTADVGATMTCVITGTNVAGNASATSNALGPVIAVGGSSTATYFIYFF